MKILLTLLHPVAGPARAIRLMVQRQAPPEDSEETLLAELMELEMQWASGNIGIEEFARREPAIMKRLNKLLGSGATQPLSKDTKP